MHKKINWNQKELITLSEKQSNDLSLLLPYWGLTLNAHTKEIQRILENKIVYIEGLDDQIFQTLKSALLHTGVMFTSTPSKTTDLHLTTNTDQHTTASIILASNYKKYHLKPLYEKTNDLQKIIHKHIWLPLDYQHLVFYYHQLNYDFYLNNVRLLNF